MTKELSDKVQRRINALPFYHLTKLSDWLTNRYWGKKETPIAHYICVRHYHLEEYLAGCL